MTPEEGAKGPGARQGPESPLPPGALLAALDAAGCGGEPLSIRQRARLPKAPGAYLILLHLPRGLIFRSGPFRGRALAPGWHVYAGSARGPGGLAARVARHLRRRKRLRWHVDRVSTRAAAAFALCFPTRGECDLVSRLLMQGAFAPSLPGFGASDCATCPAHMLWWTKGA